MLKKPAVRMAVLGVTLLGSAAAFYFIAPVFVREQPVAGYPSLAYMPTRTPPPPAETSAPSATPTATATEQPASLLNLSSAVLLAGGEFYPIAHGGQGTATIYEVAEGKRVLVLTDFEVEDGPDLHVYLAVQDPVPNQEGRELPDALDLGELKQVSGDHSYEIPTGTQLENYRSVVIWCVPFNVPFIGASLQTY
ncbi:MAG TPA: DM13 domain-containing protein [Anaerolineales bacterium]|nr:DM13 domain-containing protein [Anaerolineales bacterium]HLE74293.1 DM13 domain-containing protein [Anaerolineales bacterium]